MEDDRIKWNSRYASQESYLGERPSPFLVRELDRIRKLSPGVKALDIACGEGRNSLFLARHGFRVTGLDISDVGIGKGKKQADEEGLEIDFRIVDLDEFVLRESYDLILNFNFLLRHLIPCEIAALNPGGLLLFDTIMTPGQGSACSNPAFLLQPGELAGLFNGCDGTLLFQEECAGDGMPTARLLFRKTPCLHMNTSAPSSEHA